MTVSKHGMWASPEYSAWKSMRARCTRPTHKEFGRYGARGIAVCDEWMRDFPAFYRDMGPRPSAEHSLDRVNPDGNYTKENCRWATLTEQNRNLSNRNSPLGIRGVRVMNGRFYAHIHVASRQISLGGFPDFLSACGARKSAENRLWSNNQRVAA